MKGEGITDQNQAERAATMRSMKFMYISATISRKVRHLGNDCYIYDDQFSNFYKERYGYQISDIWFVLVTGTAFETHGHWQDTEGNKYLAFENQLAALTWVVDAVRMPLDHAVRSIHKNAIPQAMVAQSVVQWMEQRGK